MPTPLKVNNPYIFFEFLQITLAKIPTKLTTINMPYRQSFSKVLGTLAIFIKNQRTPLICL